jgi:hypothetical protein
MKFANEEKLAIFTVAYAAHGILRDLLHHGRRHDLEQLLRAGIYETARSLVDGKLSETEVNDLKSDQMFGLVASVADAIRARGSEVTPDDVPLTITNQQKQDHWSPLSRAANFLKHANRDAEKLLELDAVDTDTILMHACAAYSMVSRNPTPEMVIFYMYWLSSAPDRRAGVGDFAADIIDSLTPLSLLQRRRACAKLIRKAKKNAR